MTTEITIAAAQIESVAGDIAANAERHVEAIAAAQSSGVDLLVFPELSLTDYLSEPDVATLARTADAPEIRWIAKAAGTMAVSLGFIERGADGRAYNAQALLVDDGCRAIHRKLNLPTYGTLREGHHYGAGSALDTCDLPGGWSSATLICADAWNPALPWLAALKGIDVLLVPVASALDAVDGFDNPAGWDVNLRHTALTYGLPLVMANHCGTRGGLRFWGGSRVLDAEGRDIARCGDGPGLAIATLRRDDILAARARAPTIRDADPELVRRELDRTIAARG